jgi:predicted DsbA family dithiol-disulfide isomerase
MHDKVFENQATLSTENLKLWAQEMGLDMSKWNDCYDSKKYESEINADMASGGQSGVQGTPGFVIGIVQPDGKTVIGESIRGAQPLANFEAAIERQLAKV